MLPCYYSPLLWFFHHKHNHLITTIKPYDQNLQFLISTYLLRQLERVINRTNRLLSTLSPFNYICVIPQVSAPPNVLICRDSIFVHPDTTAIPSGIHFMIRFYSCGTELSNLWFSLRFRRSPLNLRVIYFFIMLLYNLQLQLATSLIIITHLNHSMAFLYILRLSWITTKSVASYHCRETLIIIYFKKKKLVIFI